MNEASFERKELAPELETKIHIHFFRHGEKENDSSKRNQDQLLTNRGRVQADEKGLELHVDPAVTLTYASPRPRTQETGLRAMLANTETTDAEMDLNELDALAHEKLKNAKLSARKLIVDKRLDFVNEGGPASAVYNKAFAEKRLMQWQVAESDAEMVKTGDTVTSSYSRLAGNAAELIKHYTDIGKTFYEGKIRKQQAGTFTANETMSFERLFATHQSIPESFICKILEKTQGLRAREEFVESLQGHAFAELQGFDLTISNSERGQTFTMTFPLGPELRTVEFSEEVLKEILRDKTELEKEVEKIKKVRINEDPN